MVKVGKKPAYEIKFTRRPMRNKDAPLVAYNFKR